MERNKKFELMGNEIINAIKSPPPLPGAGTLSRKHQSISDVVIKRKSMTCMDLERAQERITENLVANDERLKFACDQIEQCNQSVENEFFR